MGGISLVGKIKKINPIDKLLSEELERTGLNEGVRSHVFKLFAYIYFFCEVKIVQQSKKAYLMLEFSIVIIADIIQYLELGKHSGHFRSSDTLLPN